MKFHQLHTGQVIEAGTRTLTQDEVLAFATAFDPQWFHTQLDAAAKGPFGGLIASGWHTCSIAMRMVVDTVLHDSECFASPGFSKLRWPHPVRPGEALTLRITVDEVRRSTKRPDVGVVEWTWRMYNAQEQLVLEASATNLFDLKRAST